MTSESSSAKPNPKALSYKGFRFYWVGILAASFAVQMTSVSIGWQVYDLTRDPLFLGYVGLAQFLPALLLVLITGLAADKFPRRGIIGVCLLVEVACALGLLAIARIGGSEIWQIYAVLVTLGVARAFMGPASASLAPNLVPPEALSNAVSLYGSAWQLANIVGPVAGGLLYGLGEHFGLGAQISYGASASLLMVAAISVSLIPKPPQNVSSQATSLHTLFAGFRYIWKEKVVFGAISLDLFAVLLGGAVALMPVYARDILEVGPWGLGLLRSAPGIGAICAVVLMSRFPVRDYAGLVLFGFVAAFGLFTIIFGVSTSVWIAIPALFMMGGCDMVSVVLRETLLQLWTPDEVRGRVSAVNSVFVGASNELGEFRAGVVAAHIGAVAAVAIGGAGTMAVAGIWSVVFPGLRKQRGIDRRMV